MRYAIYYTPLPGSALHELGSQWLGRDVFGKAVSHKVEGLEPFIKDACRYGFHATLKAPFALKQGTSVENLLAQVAALGAKLQAASLRQIGLSTLNGFLALRPPQQGKDLAEIERACVCDLDSFRAAPDAEELARRNVTALSMQHQKHLADWGYPFVLDAFHFHMTLSCRLGPQESTRLLAMAERHFAPVLGSDLLIDNLTVFREPEPGAAFDVLETFPIKNLPGVSR